jgi:hypothetical protein
MSKTTDKVIALQQAEQETAQTIPSKKLKTVNIKGKPYVTVDERVKFFRDNYKNFSTETEIVHISEETVIIKATIKNSDNRIVSTGHAYEQVTSYGVNSTNHIENCETSAIGRALGFMNIGVISSIASADEVQNAIAKQNKNQNYKFKKGTLTDLQFQRAIATIKAGDYTKEQLLKTFKLSSEQTKTLQSC